MDEGPWWSHCEHGYGHVERLPYDGVRQHENINKLYQSFRCSTLQWRQSSPSLPFNVVAFISDAHRGGGGGGMVDQSVERATSGQEIVARSLLIFLVSV